MRPGEFPRAVAGPTEDVALPSQPVLKAFALADQAGVINGEVTYSCAYGGAKVASCIACRTMRSDASFLCAKCERERKNREEDERIRKAFERATKVPLDEYVDGMVCVPGGDGEHYIANEDAHDDPERMWERAFELEDGRRFLWATTEFGASASLEDFVSEQVLEEHHEAAFEWVDRAKLDAAQKLLDEALAAVRSFEEDQTIAVIVPPPEPDRSLDVPYGRCGAECDPLAVSYRMESAGGQEILRLTCKCGMESPAAWVGWSKTVFAPVVEES